MNDKGAKEPLHLLSIPIEEGECVIKKGEKEGRYSREERG